MELPNLQKLCTEALTLLKTGIFFTPFFLHFLKTKKFAYFTPNIFLCFTPKFWCKKNWGKTGRPVKSYIINIL